jgi:tetratricopeptide (TPR) repeat protein
MAALVVLSLSATPAAQAPLSAEAARLRALFFLRDFETGVLEGEKLVAGSPNASDLYAWYVLNLVRGGEEKRAVALAEEITKKKPQDPWAWFALAGALNYQSERPADAVSAGEKALKLLPNNPDIIWIRAQTLANDQIANSDGHGQRPGDGLGLISWGQDAHGILPARPERTTFMELTIAALG